MTISYEVKRLRGSSADSNLSIQNGERRVVRTLEEQYIIIFDPASINQETPDPASVGLLSGVPQVGGWSYYDAIQQKYYPNFTCRSVSIEREEQNPFIFRATASYSDESNSDSQDIQSDSESYTPSINWSLESKNVTEFFDVDGNMIRLPTGNLYEGISPVKEVPVFVATIEQIEASLSLPILQQRYKTVNDATWLGFPKHTAMIDNISYDNALVPVSDGNGGVNFQNAYRVTYTVKCMNHTIKSLKDDETLEDLQDKWGYSLARVDDWHVVWFDASDNEISGATAGAASPNNPAGAAKKKKRPIMVSDNSARPSVVYLKENGAPHKEELTMSSVPPIDQFVVQEESNFSSFLRVT